MIAGSVFHSYNFETCHWKHVFPCMYYVTAHLCRNRLEEFDLRVLRSLLLSEQAFVWPDDTAREHWTSYALYDSSDCLVHSEFVWSGHLGSDVLVHWAAVFIVPKRSAGTRMRTSWCGGCVHCTSRGRRRARTKEGGGDVDSEYWGGKYIYEPMGICPVFKNVFRNVKKKLRACIDTFYVRTESFAEKRFFLSA